MNALIIDTHDLYWRVYKKYRKKINYSKLLEHIEKLIGPVGTRIAFVTRPKGPVTSFTGLLRHLKFVIDDKMGDENNSIELTIAAMQLDSTDTFIFGTGDMILLPLFYHLRRLGKKVIVLTCDIPYTLSKQADQIITIDDSMLGEDNGGTAPQS